MTSVEYFLRRDEEHKMLLSARLWINPIVLIKKIKKLKYEFIELYLMSNMGF